MRFLILLFAALVLTASCGKKAPLRPPPDDKPPEQSFPG